MVSGDGSWQNGALTATTLTDIPFSTVTVFQSLLGIFIA